MKLFSLKLIIRPLYTVALIAILAPAVPVRAGDAPLTLEEAIELAVTRNERTAAADARFDATEARVDRARAFFFPEVTATGNYTRRAYETVREIGGEQVTIQSRDAVSGTAFLNGVVYNARAFPLYRQARLQRDSSRLTAEDEERIVAFEATSAFIATLSAEQFLSAAERRRDFASESLADARARFDAELVSSNDVTRAVLELATAEREVTIARGQVESALLQLGNLLNADVTGPLAMPANLLEVAQTLAPETSIDDAIARRPDLQASRLEVDALRAFAREPLLRFIPSLNYTGQYRRTNEGGLSGRESDWNLGLALSWTLFDGGDAFAENAERKALVRAAELDQQRIERAAGVEIRSAAVDLRSEQASIRQAVVATEAARKNAAETTELYRQGLASALEVADANLSLFAAEVAEVRARYQLTLAYLDYRAAKGFGPLDGR
ncbi:MAG: TolC family protein [Thermoanaerobaculia bacterium]